MMLRKDQEDELDAIIKKCIEDQDEYRGLLMRVLCLIGIFGLFCGNMI